MAFEFELPPAPTENIKVDLGEADIVRRSASTVPQPARKLTEVAKLIDVSKCIGCKACQVACLEWNDKTERIGFNYGVYDDPVDLTPESFTVMRFTEWINPESQNLEWLIRKYQLHAQRRSGGTSRQVWRPALSRNISTVSSTSITVTHYAAAIASKDVRLTSAHFAGRLLKLGGARALLRPRRRRPRSRLRQVVSDTCHRVRYQRRDEAARR